MPAIKFIPRIVNLTETEYSIIRSAADELGLGQKGFSATVRFIIREWRELKSRSLQTPASTPLER